MFFVSDKKKIEKKDNLQKRQARIIYAAYNISTQG